MESIVSLDTYYSPSELEQAIASFVLCYNQQRYHEAPDNLTPADVYFGKREEVMTQPERIKQQTLQYRREHYLLATFYSAQKQTFSRVEQHLIILSNTSR